MAMGANETARTASVASGPRRQGASPWSIPAGPSSDPLMATSHVSAIVRLAAMGRAAGADVTRRRLRWGTDLIAPSAARTDQRAEHEPERSARLQRLAAGLDRERPPAVVPPEVSIPEIGWGRCPSVLLLTEARLNESGQ